MSGSHHGLAYVSKQNSGTRQGRAPNGGLHRFATPERHRGAVEYQKAEAIRYSRLAVEGKRRYLEEKARCIICRKRVSCTSGSKWGRITNELKHHPWARRVCELSQFRAYDFGKRYARSRAKRRQE